MLNMGKKIYITEAQMKAFTRSLLIENTTVDFVKQFINNIEPEIDFIEINGEYDGEIGGCAAFRADHLIANGVVVRERGEWRNNKDEYPECTRCGYMPQYDPMIDDIYYSDFCPHCGSDMRGAVNDG